MLPTSEGSMVLLVALAGLLPASFGGGDPCADALRAACGTAHAQGLAPCVSCVTAHDANLTAAPANCTTVEKEQFCANPGPLPPPPPPPIGRPADCPCIRWVHSSCALGAAANVGAFLPAIYTAWQWRGSKTPSGQDTGKCVPCSGKSNDIYCAYIFPCYSTTWGHRVGRHPSAHRLLLPLCHP